MRRRIVLTMLLAVLAVMFASSGAWAVIMEGKYYIDSNGGNCSSIGIWNSGTSTCTLSTDASSTTSYQAVIEIRSNGITLDGNGYTVSGGNNACVWLSQQYQNGVTIKNLDFTKCWRGIETTEFSSGITITDNKMYPDQYGSPVHHGIYATSLYNSVISNNDITAGQTGFSFAGTSSNIQISCNIVNTAGLGSPLGLTRVHSSRIMNNILESNSGTALYAYGCHSSIFSNNLIQNSSTGFHIQFTNDAIFRLNSIENNGVGILVYNGGGNNSKIYNNNLIGNQTDVALNTTNNISFNEPSPIGGNYWDAYTACSDSDADGFCDDPYTPVTGVTDNLPLTGKMAFGCE